MTVRAKFVVNSKEETKYSEDIMVTIKATPVYGNTPEHENSKFWKYTPSGQLNLGTINKAAADYFQLGKQYYVDFTLASE